MNAGLYKSSGVSREVTHILDNYRRQLRGNRFALKSDDHGKSVLLEGQAASHQLQHLSPIWVSDYEQILSTVKQVESSSKL